MVLIEGALERCVTVVVSGGAELLGVSIGIVEIVVV